MNAFQFDPLEDPSGEIYPSLLVEHDDGMYRWPALVEQPLPYVLTLHYGFRHSSHMRLLQVVGEVTPDGRVTLDPQVLAWLRGDNDGDGPRAS